jgi:hypothetical protein
MVVKRYPNFRLTTRYSMTEIQKTRPGQAFFDRIPPYVSCTDDFRLGTRTVPRSEAVKKKHIRHNFRSVIYWMSFDVDHAHSKTLWMTQDVPAPNIITTNPENGHSHLLYGLDVPVNTGKSKQAAYFRAARAAMGAKLGADRAFSGVYTKNPLVNAWNVYTPRQELYELGELAEYCTLRPQKTVAAAPGVGRNCNLFDTVRYIAYREAQAHRPFGIHAWQRHIRAIAVEENLCFAVPMSDAEVKAIAKSIANWTWDHCRETPAQIASRRGSMKGKTIRESGIKMLQLGRTAREVAKALEVSPRTVSRWQKACT